MQTQESIVYSQYLLNGAWVLLPLAPAILIYLIFPKTDAVASGPLKGFTIKVGGALAAYVVIFLITLPIVQIQNNSLNTLLRPSWEISGQVEVDNAAGNAINLSSAQTPISVSLKPDPIQLLGGDRFKIIVPEIYGQIPVIEINYKDYGDAVVDVSNPDAGESITRNNTDKRININSKIVIKQTCAGSLCKTPS
jgi:hypothetical protein